MTLLLGYSIMNAVSVPDEPYSEEVYILKISADNHVFSASAPGNDVYRKYLFNSPISAKYCEDNWFKSRNGNIQSLLRDAFLNKFRVRVIVDSECTIKNVEILHAIYWNCWYC